MKIVVASADNRGLDGQVSAHFGRCEYYTVVEVEDGRIKNAETVANPTLVNHQPGMAPQFIAGLGAQVMLTGGMGPRAIQIFDHFGISAATGASGQVRTAVEAYLAGQIEGAEACAHSDHDDGHGHDHGHGHGHGHGHHQGAIAATATRTSPDPKDLN